MNYDFLKFEKKKIIDLSNWYNRFQKAEINKYLDAASFYVKPVSLNSSWKAAIAEYGTLIILVYRLYAVLPHYC